MPKFAFVLLRVLTALASLGALAGTLIALLFVTIFRFVSEGASIFVFVAKLFLTAFQRPGTSPQHQSLISLPLAALAILFICMFLSVFLPGQRVFLHVIAALSAAAAAWRLWAMAHDPQSHMLYLPVIALWFVYYVACILS